MREPDEGDLNVWGDLEYANEAVLLRGATEGWANIHHEADDAQTLHSVVAKIGGKVTGDAALLI